MIVRHKLDPIARFPSHADKHGKAWRLDLEEVRRRHGVEASRDAALDFWLVEAPWANPIWHSYVIGLQHLRPVVEGEPIVVKRPGATHEFFVAALDPGAPREPFVRGESSPAVLRPLNFVAQLVEQSDEAARERVRGAVMKICAGTLSPDVDFQSQWVAMFGGYMLQGRRAPEGVTLQ